MTDTIKYSLGALGLIFILFLYNRSSQRSLEMDGQAIFNGSEEEIFKMDEELQAEKAKPTKTKKKKELSEERKAQLREQLKKCQNDRDIMQ